MMSKARMTGIISVRRQAHPSLLVRRRRMPLAAPAASHMTRWAQMKDYTGILRESQVLLILACSRKESQVLFILACSQPVAPLTLLSVLSVLACRTIRSTLTSVVTPAYSDLRARLILVSVPSTPVLSKRTAQSNLPSALMVTRLSQHAQFAMKILCASAAPATQAPGKSHTLALKPVSRHVQAKKFERQACLCGRRATARHHHRRQPLSAGPQTPTPPQQLLPLPQRRSSARCPPLFAIDIAQLPQADCSRRRCPHLQLLHLRWCGRHGSNR